MRKGSPCLQGRVLPATVDGGRLVPVAAGAAPLPPDCASKGAPSPCWLLNMAGPITSCMTWRPGLGGGER